DGLGYLVAEVLGEGGDAVVLEPADARRAVLHAAQRLSATHDTTTTKADGPTRRRRAAVA
ncbi:MAG TPA: hypothetical protein VG474_15120, partial [Solirubrobacteraceae bacterium]|nr:hypothetical protein [Solirubrobacteraceae bacterium]